MRRLFRFPLILMPLLLSGLGVARSALAVSAAAYSPSEERARSLVSAQIERDFPGSKVELAGDVQWTSGGYPAVPASVRILGESAQGYAHFEINPSDSARAGGEGWVAFRAEVPAYVAKRRVFPGESLDPSSFAVQSVDVASGLAREYRGVLLPIGSGLTGLQTRQTFLEGQFLVSTGVERIPDIRRGEPVQIKLITGDVVLSTSGTAEEPAYLDQLVHVMAGKTKRGMLGRLKPNGVVEVSL